MAENAAVEGLNAPGWALKLVPAYDAVNDVETVSLLVVSPEVLARDRGVHLSYPLTGRRIVEALRRLADVVERGGE